MTINQAIKQLLIVEENKQAQVYTPETICIGLSRVGHDDQQIISGPMKELIKIDFGAPLHAVVIPGNMHFMEKEHVDSYQITEYDRIRSSSINI